MDKDDKNDKEEKWFIALKEWIISNGGKIHPSLTLKNNSLNDNHNNHNDNVDVDDNTSRGIFAKNQIKKGEILISLPSQLVISGQHLPIPYKKQQSPSKGGANTASNTSTGTKDSDCDNAIDNVNVNASPWLRCVSAFMLENLSKYEKNMQSTTSSSSSSSMKYSPYINSLPSSYETLLHRTSWSDEEIKNLLSGTTIGNMVLNDRLNNTLRKNYIDYVCPYLQSNGIIPNKDESSRNESTQSNGCKESMNNINNNNDDDDNQYYQLFEMACACISTRGFHLRKEETMSTSSSQSSNEQYSGPFLLPFIDLLNHSSSMQEKCTMLQRGIETTTATATSHTNHTKDGFFMIAERTIQKGEEILHSYANGTTSGQLLQTFGFVEDISVKRAIDLSFSDSDHASNSSTTTNSNTNGNHPFTSSLLSKQKIIDACSQVSLSTYPNQLKEIINKKNQNVNNNQNNGNWDDVDDIDEVWEIPTHVKHRVKDTEHIIPNEIQIQIQQEQSGEDILCDELVTLCCILFLPDEAYEELVGEESINSNDDHDDQDRGIDNHASSSLCLLTKDILEDYYLGKLVFKAILLAIEQKLQEYAPILLSHLSVEHDKITSCNDKIKADQLLLKQLLEMKHEMANGKVIQHAMYSLTVRIEEKACLYLLKRRVIELFDRLDDDESEFHADSTSNGNFSKRIKL